jgi:hypothetical protein
MQVAVLRSDSDNYQTVALVDDSQWAELIEMFDGSPMAASWKPVEIEVLYKGERSQSDFPEFSGLAVFSARAADVLRDVLEPHGELLELNCTNGDYYVYNVTNVVDALDEDASEVKRFRSSGRIMRVISYEFKPDALGAPVFKLPQLVKSYVFVTDEFVRRAEEAGLNGFDFSDVVWQR